MALTAHHPQLHVNLNGLICPIILETNQAEYLLVNHGQMLTSFVVSWVLPSLICIIFLMKEYFSRNLILLISLIKLQSLYSQWNNDIPLEIWISIYAKFTIFWFYMGIFTFSFITLDQFTWILFEIEWKDWQKYWILMEMKNQFIVPLLHENLNLLM